jgi:hypothetical protein
MKNILIAFLVICFSCRQLRDSKPYDLNFISPNDTIEIRFDGFYNKIDTTTINYDCDSKEKRCNEIYSSIDLVVFNKSNIYVSGGGTINDEPYKCSYYKMIADWHKEHKKEIFGNFLIKKDSIYAYLPITLNTWGMIPRIVKCNYRGYMKNKETITDWQVVPPYPKGISKFIFENNPKLFKPQTLYFVKTDAVKCLKTD